MYCIQMDQVIVLWKKRIRFSEKKKQLKMKWGFPNLIIEFSVDIFGRPAIDSWNPKDIYSLGYKNINFLKIQSIVVTCPSQCDKTKKHQ